MVGDSLENEKKRLLIEVSNHELNALEDLLTLDYKNHKESKQKDRNTLMSFWQRLVKEWDK